MKGIVSIFICMALLCALFSGCGGEIDTERMAKVLMDEYRGSKLGRFTLELPEEIS